VEDRKNDAIAILKAQKIPQENYLQFWSTLDEDYFMRHNALEIAWQAECISKHPGEDALVAIRTEDKKHLAQTQILTYTKDAKNLFAATVSIIAQLNLSVVDARIISTRNGMALNSYIVLDENGQHDPAPSQHEEIIQRLTNALNKPEKFIEVVKNSARRRPSRRHRQFKIKPEAKITQSENRNYTNIEIRALDQPGLLALIGAIFMQFDLILRNARISTLGETVEDIFFVSTSNNEAISDPLLCAEIKATIEKTLSEFASDNPPENIIAGAIETVN
jgi:[protein-PII] uridylyltransferase